MEEHQVTAEGETRRLPEPFFVIATQNPSNQVGTFALPESQLDRFLMRIELGYPDRNAERALLQGADRRDMISGMEACLAPGELIACQQSVKTVNASDALIDYVQALVEHSRRAPEFASGLSPRAALSLLHASRAWALLQGRDKVIPEDVQAIHDRMPRILSRLELDSWLNPHSDPAKLAGWIAQTPGRLHLHHRPVTREVNSPRNDSPALLETPPETDLFGNPSEG